MLSLRLLQALPDRSAVEVETEPPPPLTKPEDYNVVSKTLFEPNFGAAIVREEVPRDILLRDIRFGLVKGVHYFRGTWAETAVTEGCCLAEYQDGSVKQSFVPVHDFRYVLLEQACSTQLLQK
jgi:hypothetical protein